VLFFNLWYNVRMSKKDYIAIAKIIKGYSPNPAKFRDAMGASASFTALQITGDLADYFESRNPKFDRIKFLEACGVCK